MSLNSLVTTHAHNKNISNYNYLTVILFLEQSNSFHGN